MPFLTFEGCPNGIWNWTWSLVKTEGNAQEKNWSCHLLLKYVCFYNVETSGIIIYTRTLLYLQFKFFSHCPLFTIFILYSCEGACQLTRLYGAVQCNKACLELLQNHLNEVVIRVCLGSVLQYLLQWREHKPYKNEFRAVAMETHPPWAVTRIEAVFELVSVGKLLDLALHTSVDNTIYTMIMMYILHAQWEYVVCLHSALA